MTRFVARTLCCRRPGTLRRARRLALGLVLLVMFTPAAGPAQLNPRAQRSPSQVTVRFEAGLTSLVYAEVMAALGREQLLPLTVHLDSEGGTPAEILARSGRLVGSSVGPALDRYLCQINPHACRLVGQAQTAARTEWRNTRAPSGATLPDEACPSDRLPRYALCIPDVRVRTYQTSVLKRYNPGQGESLRDLVRQSGGCEELDERCKRLIRNLNKEDVFAAGYMGGLVRLPAQASSVTLAVHSPDHLDRLKQTVDDVLQRLERTGQLTRDQRSVYYTVPSPVHQYTSHVPPGSPPAGEPIQEYLEPLRVMGYPFIAPGSFPSPLARVVIGVWDFHVDEKHCDLEATDGSVPLVVENLERQADDPPTPRPVPQCGDRRAMLERKWDHGTYVAGLIAARLNGRGIAGVNPKAVLWTYEIDADGRRLEDDDDPIIKQAERIEPPVVVNVSFSVAAQVAETRIESLIRKHRDLTLFVTAAGNDGRPVLSTSQCRIVPACLAADPSPDADNVVSVVALDREGKDRLKTERTPSNYGPVFDVAAVGEAVSTLYGHAHGAATGTSVAAPYVTGLASLIYAYARQFELFTPSPRELKDRILYTADFSETLDAAVRFGRINFARALDLRRDTVVLKAGFCTPGPSCDPQPVAVRKTGDDQLTVLEGRQAGVDVQPFPLRLVNVRRIAAKDDTPNSRYWVAYLDQQRMLRKLQDVRFEGTPVVRYKDGRQELLMRIRDYTCAMRCRDPQ